MLLRICLGRLQYGMLLVMFADTAAGHVTIQTLGRTSFQHLVEGDLSEALSVLHLAYQPRNPIGHQVHHLQLPHSRSSALGRPECMHCNCRFPQQLLLSIDVSAARLCGALCTPARQPRRHAWLVL